MKFPDLIIEKEKLVGTFSREFQIPIKDVRVIASPYRIAPLGAHIDHQGGPVLGMTINAYSLLAYVPGNNGQVCLCSENYPGQLNFNLRQIPATTNKFWGSYALAAALALNEDWPLVRGVSGLISGILPGCGLSSSASALLAYLYALADANGLQLQPWDFVKLTRRAENKYIGRMVRRNETDNTATEPASAEP